MTALVGTAPHELGTRPANVTHTAAHPDFLPPAPPSYSALPHMVSFSERVAFVGGINKPKLVRVTDSEGAEHKQLVKSGSDDMRQVGGREGGGCHCWCTTAADGSR